VYNIVNEGGTVMAEILIVEDEQPINDLVKKSLTRIGHSCTQAFDGAEASEIFDEGKFDLIILDIMLPEKDGFEFAAEVENTPIIFLTAKSGLADKVRGLKLADDYIVKPFEILELIARVEAVLRRVKKNTSSIAFDNVRIDFSARRAYLDNEEVMLSPKEFELLEILIINRNLALSRDKLITHVWGFDFEGDERTVDVHIRNLRKKLNIDGRIKTVFKTGYRFELDHAEVIK
jgi:DNA-binding response OmpR family regulator